MAEEPTPVAWTDEVRGLRLQAGLRRHFSAQRESSQLIECLLDKLTEIFQADRCALLAQDSCGEAEAWGLRGLDHSTLVSAEFSDYRRLIQGVLKAPEPVFTSSGVFPMTQPHHMGGFPPMSTFRTMLLAPLPLPDRGMGLIYLDKRIRKGLLMEPQLKVLLLVTAEFAEFIGSL